MKKKNFLLPLLILLAYFITGMLMTGCSQYTCPTYSTNYTVKHMSPKKQKAMANYKNVNRIRY